MSKQKGSTIEPETRENIRQCAKALSDACQEALDKLESYEKCDTPEKRDSWINLVALQCVVENWT